MDISSAYNSGAMGLQRAAKGMTEATVNINRETTNQQRVQNAQQNAQDAAAVQQTTARQNTVMNSATSGTPSLEQSLVQLNVEQRSAEANVRSMQTADEVLGSVIDIRV